MRKKKVTEQTMWIVSVFNTPHEIMAHDITTMSRFHKLFCGGRTKSPCRVIVREVLNAKVIGHSQHSIDEHRAKHT